jgi:hypothetical protein
MGLSFGGGSKNEPSFVSKKAGELLLEAFFPGTQSSRKGDIPEDIARFLKERGGRTDSVLAGLPGVATTSTTFGDGSKPNILAGQGGGGGFSLDSFADSPFIGFDPTRNEGQFPGFSGGLPEGLSIGGSTGRTVEDVGASGSLLPSISSLAQFDTVFEKADSNRLSPTANAIVGSALNAITQPISSQSSQAINSILSTPAPAKLPDPPNIGELTTNIFNSLPSEFRAFTENILNDSTPEQIDAELDNLSQKLSEQAELDAETTGGRLLSVFSSQGATGGSAIQASKDLAVEITTRTNATIAQARVNALDTLVRAREQGVQILNSLLQAGANEQANIVRQRVAELESQTAIQVAKINASVSLQGQLNQLKLGQLSLTGDLFNALVQQSTAEEEARINALGLPFNTLTALATGGGQSQQTKPSFGFSLF